LASDREVLAWEAADKNIDRRRVDHGRDVVKDLNVRPMRCEYAALPRVQFALPTDLEACLLEAEVGTADTRERAAYGQRSHAATLRFRDW
tara:strand:- start:1501 stop:1770 length:270 start_codon:yes stop_codon:yes gene_type:complete